MNNKNRTMKSIKERAYEAARNWMRKHGHEVSYLKMSKKEQYMFTYVRNVNMRMMKALPFAKKDWLIGNKGRS